MMKSFQNPILEHQPNPLSQNRTLTQSIDTPSKKLDRYSRRSFDIDPLGKEEYGCNKSINGDSENYKMKEIIRLNQEYFRSKLDISQNFKPSNKKLKIPSSIGNTMYQQNYAKKDKHYTNSSKSQDFTKKNLQLNFSALSTYQDQYIKHIPSDNKLKKKSSLTVDRTSPTGKITQYGNNFVNWGMKNSLQPLKPYDKYFNPAVPFQANSQYREEYSPKALKPREPIVNKSTLQNLTKPNMFLGTTNQAQFKNKPIYRESNCKPKNRILDTGVFGGKSEYQGQFLSNQNERLHRKQNRTLQDLQNLIIDL